MQTTTLQVKGMSCSHCENAVKQAAMGVGKVTAVNVDLKTGAVTIEHDGADIQAVVAAIVEEGYEV